MRFSSFNFWYGLVEGFLLGILYCIDGGRGGGFVEAYLPALGLVEHAYSADFSILLRCVHGHHDHCLASHAVVNDFKSIVVGV